MHRCGRCEEYFLGGNPCDCKSFGVFVEDDKYGSFWAHSSKDAALKFARHYNEDDDYTYELMNSRLEIEVKAENGNITKYSVRADPDILYSCHEIK